MENINEVNKNHITNHVKQGERTGRAGKDEKKVAQQSAVDTVTNQTNKLIIELNINIKFEAKSRIEVQAAIDKYYESTETDLSQYRVNGKRILDLSQEEAAELISEDGFYGVAQTAQRIIDFALNGAGDDVERLQIARDAVLQGFKEAENIFGGSLPEISYQTLDKVLEELDANIRELGGSVVNVEA